LISLHRALQAVIKKGCVAILLHTPSVTQKYRLYNGIRKYTDIRPIIFMKAL